MKNKRYKVKNITLSHQSEPSTDILSAHFPFPVDASMPASDAVKSAEATDASAEVTEEQSRGGDENTDDARAVYTEAAQ